MLVFGSTQANTLPHPFYISVTEIRINKSTNQMTVSCRMFMDDLEEAIDKLFDMHIDIIRSIEKQSYIDVLSQYIYQHLQIMSGGKFCLFQMVGYEIEDEAVWCHFLSENIVFDGTLQITNRLLYDFLSGQTNIIHVYVNEDRQTTRLIYPEAKTTYPFN